MVYKSTIPDDKIRETWRILFKRQKLKNLNFEFLAVDLRSVPIWCHMELYNFIEKKMTNFDFFDCIISCSEFSKSLRQLSFSTEEL